MSRNQKHQLLTQELAVSQILRTFGKNFTQIRKRYSDELNGRCALGVIMSYYGWDGNNNSNAPRSFQTVLQALKKIGIRHEFVIELNDSGYSFNEIAEYLDNISK